MRVAFPTPVTPLIVIHCVASVDISLVSIAELCSYEATAEAGIGDIVSGTEMVGHVGEWPVWDTV